MGLDREPSVGRRGLRLVVGVGLSILVLFALAGIERDVPSANAQVVPGCINVFGKLVIGGSAIPRQECDALTALYEATGGADWAIEDGWGIADSPFTDPCRWTGVTCELVTLDGVLSDEFRTVVGLRLVNAHLVGPIPPEIAGLERLRELSIYNQDPAEGERSDLQGPLATEIGELTELQAIRMFDVDLEGEIEPFLGNLTQLEILSLSSNGLTGSVPPELGALAQLRFLSLDDNQLTGFVPDDLTLLTRALIISLEDNGCLSATSDATVSFLSFRTGEFGSLGLFAGCRLVDDSVVHLGGGGEQILSVFDNDMMPPEMVTSLSLVEPAPVGSVRVAGTEIRYRSNGRSLTDTFQYRKCAGVYCSRAMVTVTVTPPVCDGLDATIWGTSGSENLVGTAADDVIFMGDGDDAVSALGGNDVVCGGLGNDRITGGEGNDIILGGEGDDSLSGGLGNDSVYGEAGIDDLRGGDGDDKLYGAQGADELRGGDGDDVLHGNRGDDLLFGDAGNDRIFGYANNDTIDGGPGDDRLHGNFGDDVMTGGDGDDRMFGYGDNDQINGGNGDDLIGGNFGDDVINGGNDDDTLYGSDGADQVNGDAGNDQVAGNSGPDTVTGGPGNDALDGGINPDICNGGPGTDTAVRCETLQNIP